MQAYETGLMHDKSSDVVGWSDFVDGSMHLNNSDVGVFAGTAFSAESWGGLQKDEFS
jgi:hypothetical protein